MHLKKIKLSGFKSFVDPTTVPLASNLVAVVGPNGCGKSNIIDAVCWVMGESSAKYLRGESLTDVIFNGSSSRKPVGLASVELLFDNQDGSLGGEYSSYSEISIRRQITREGDSSYFLNGSRCRRKDIIDIFLGTGLGPRSYSIIGQNMISRLIEAKPDDMRIYLEEAAGVSKYKERRRETENRINHTKENLARLTDLRLELEKQLGSLKRQANAAEKFKTLKQQERSVRAQWIASQWRHLDSHLVHASLQIQQQETGLEAKHADLTDLNLKLETKRESQGLALENLQDVQRQYYAAGNEITRLEQEIRHTQQRQNQWKADIEQTEKDYLVHEGSLNSSREKLTLLNNDIVQLEPQLFIAKETAQKTAEMATISENEMQAWQSAWDAFHQRSAKTMQVAQVEQARIQQLEQRSVSLTQNQERCVREQQQIDFLATQQAVAVLSDQVIEAEKHHEQQQQHLSEVRQSINQLQTTLHQTTKQLDQTRQQLQRLSGQQASLDALQKTALGQRNNPVVNWLTKHNLNEQPRLAQSIEVEAGWEYAVEKVLGANLQAICIDDLASIMPLTNQLTTGNLCAFQSSVSTTENVLNPVDSSNTLLSKIKSPLALDALVSGVYTAKTLEEAQIIAKGLQSHESVITPDGIWMGSSWVRILREERPEAGVFQRESELKQLCSQIKETEKAKKQLENQITELQENSKALELKRDELQKSVNQAFARVSEIKAQQKVQEQRTAELQSRYERLQKEQADSSKQLSQIQTELKEARSRWETAMTAMEAEANERDSLTQQKEDLKTKVQTARQDAQLAKERVHQLEMKLQTKRSESSSLQQQINQLEKQLTNLAQRKEVLLKELNAIPPIENLEKSLEEVLKQRLQIEDSLHECRSNATAIEQELKDFEQQRQEIEREMNKYRDILETLRVESQGLRVKSDTLREQIQQIGMSLEETLKQLSEEISVEELHSQLEELTQRINRLGPINLMAIEEYDSCSERKQYLDAQNADLQEGLATLENAIAKIDKETRTRFKETFDKVNERFQELFPKIFGGGRAYLELTGENLLDAGITVMACPPGKRNSTIHLLSGGEKAMTAIALVFSIFHLNPAPFCLLDEVDAPLDDANIGRFCQMVKSMAEKTQFIFISHNKLAIEMAEHLMGVTMHEPGVSRLVSVNVEEAVTLAGA